MAHAFNPSTWVAEACSQSGLQREFQDSQGCRKTLSGKTKHHHRIKQGETDLFPKWLF